MDITRISPAIIGFSFFPLIAGAANYGQIIVDSSNSGMNHLQPGDTVTFNGLNNPISVAILVKPNQSFNADNINIFSEHALGGAIQVDANSSINISNSYINSTNGGGVYGLSESIMNLTDTTIRYDNSDTALNTFHGITGGKELNLNNVIIESPSETGFFGISAATSGTTIKNTTIKGAAIGLALAPHHTVGPASSISDSTISASWKGIQLQSRSSAPTFSLHNVDITVTDKFGEPSKGIMIDCDYQCSKTSLIASNLTINMEGNNSSGINTTGYGSAAIDNSRINIRGDRSRGLDVSAYSNIVANAMEIFVDGENSYGAYVEGSREFSFLGVSDTTLTLNKSSILTKENASHGIYQANAPEQITLDNSTIHTQGANAYALYAAFIEDPATDYSNFNPGKVSIINSTLSTDRADAIFVDSGSLDLSLSNSTITPGKNMNLLTASASRKKGTPAVGDITITADHSTLTGNIQLYKGNTQLTLKNQSVYQGAIYHMSGNDGQTSVTTATQGQWKISGDSAVTRVDNQGVIAFTHRDDRYYTLTTNNYRGGGLLVMNAALGADNSPSDRLVINGGKASGTTQLRLLNTRPNHGDQTLNGITLVEAINGAITDQNAFVLDSRSTGYRASTRTLASGAYDYHLLRSSSGNWYLASQKSITPTPEPTPQPTPTPPPSPVSPPSARHDYRPETGAYAGNQFAALTLFRPAMSQRVSAPKSDSLWLLTSGGKTKNLLINQSDVQFDIDYQSIHLGSDIFSLPLANGQWSAGLMAGYGQAKTKADAKSQNVKTSAQGRVTGYFVGAYSTWRQSQEWQPGAYVDSSLQYAWYNNKVSSELTPEYYDSQNFSLTVESGYAFQPVTAVSWLIEPQLELAWNHYRANSYQDSTGTLVKSEKTPQFASRVGLRLFNNGLPAYTPYLTTSWWHSYGDNQVKFDGTKVTIRAPEDVVEAKLGVKSSPGNALQLWGEVNASLGENDYQNIGGTVGISYRW